MNFQSMTLYQAMRQSMALLLSLLLIPTAHLDLYAQAPAAYIELNAIQLDQLVAPIALDPDPMVAQILTAATYPDQIGAADAWLNQNMNLPPAQRAAGADAQPWDPSVKGLIEYPAVLDNLARNPAWASQLGNAYYNQPSDVMNAVQAMRVQAQQANVLVTTPQQRVVVDAGLITIVPVNPALVYVPYYNPWRVWGGLFSPYPGFVVVAPPPGIVLGVGLAFGVGIALGVYGGFGWGFGRWSPGWGGGTVLYGGRAYISRSVTVYNHGNFGGHDRGVFEHGGRGVPGGFHAAAHMGAAREAAARGGFDRGGARGGFDRGGAGRSAFAGRGEAGRPGAAGRPGGVGRSEGGARAGAARPGGLARGGAPAARGGAPAARGGAPAARGGAPAARGGAPAARGGAPAARGGAPAARSAAPAARGGGAPAARGGAPSGGHAAPTGGGRRK